MATAVILLLPACDPPVEPDDGMVDIVKVVNELQGKSLSEVEATMQTMGLTEEASGETAIKVYSHYENGATEPDLAFTVMLTEKDICQLAAGVQMYADSTACRKKWINKYQPAIKLSDVLGNAFNDVASTVRYDYSVESISGTDNDDIQTLDYVNMNYFGQQYLEWEYCYQADLNKPETCYYYSIEDDKAGTGTDGFVKWTSTELISHMTGDLKTHVSARNGLTDKEYIAKYAGETVELMAVNKLMTKMDVLVAYFNMREGTVAYGKGNTNPMEMNAIKKMVLKYN